jgi:hypothetical protein
MRKKYELRHEFVVTTKELVDNLLENMIDTNRTLTMKTVNGYARDMKLGLWMISDSSICVSNTGKTLNGMHRLIANRKAGYPPIPISVMYGFDEEAIKIMDRGKPRSIADVMTIDGIKVSRKVVSACVVCLKENDPTFLSIRPTANDVTKTFEQVKNSFAYLNQAEGFHALQAPIMAALVAEHKHTNSDRILDFCKNYLTGAMLSQDSPILALRESLNQTRPFTKGFKEQRIDFFLTSTAIQSYVGGEPLTKKSLNGKLRQKIKHQKKIASAVNKAKD